jgi:hypothetical protein
MFIHQDLTSEPRYLVTFTVGIGQKANIDAAVKKVIDRLTVTCLSKVDHIFVP